MDLQQIIDTEYTVYCGTVYICWHWNRFGAIIDVILRICYSIFVLKGIFDKKSTSYNLYTFIVYFSRSYQIQSMYLQTTPHLVVYTIIYADRADADTSPTTAIHVWLKPFNPRPCTHNVLYYSILIPYTHTHKHSTSMCAESCLEAIHHTASTAASSIPRHKRLQHRLGLIVRWFRCASCRYQTSPSHFLYPPTQTIRKSPSTFCQWASEQHIYTCVFSIHSSMYTEHTTHTHMSMFVAC